VVDPRLDRPRRASDDRRDLIDRQVFEEVQDEHLAVPHVERGERAMQRRGVLGVEPGFVVRRLGLVDLPGERTFGGGPRDVAADMVDGVAARVSLEPRAQRCGLVQTAELAECRDPDRLKDVEGRLVVADDRPREIQ
jgi:hypothetical protein